MIMVPGGDNDVLEMILKRSTHKDGIHNGYDDDVTSYEPKVYKRLFFIPRRSLNLGPVTNNKNECASCDQALAPTSSAPAATPEL